MSRAAEIRAWLVRAGQLLGLAYTRLKNMSGNERAALYSLPLFAQWVFAFTWERDPGALRAAGRNQVLSIGFLVCVGAIYILESLVTSLFPVSGYHVAWVSLATHSLAAFVYVSVSCVLCFREYRGAPLSLEPLDRAAVQLEAWAGR